MPVSRLHCAKQYAAEVDEAERKKTG